MKKNIDRLKRLSRNIAEDLNDIEKLRNELNSLQIERTNIRIIESILHDFYTAIERIFCRVAEEMEGGLPNKRSWHISLLVEMSRSLEGVRPAVITPELRDNLQQYLEFRHLFRNIYGFELKVERVLPLVESFEKVFQSSQSASNGSCNS
jgi:hypothetical protein